MMPIFYQKNTNSPAGQKSSVWGKNMPGAKKGSALLITVLVMGVLLLLTLGLSDLVIREIRETTDVVSAGKAYFAAEAGIENALLDLHENLPGYEVKDYKQVNDDVNNFSFRYRVLNSADKIPYFDPDKPLFLSPNDPAISSNVVYDLKPEATYNVLGLNETHYIPLSSALYGDVQDFLIEYYFTPDPDGTDPILNNPENFNNIDVLRWKIFGYKKNGDAVDTSQTDAISDLYPALHGNGPESPVCIGTDSTLESATSNTVCKFPAPGNTSLESIDQSTWGTARECYTSEAGLPSSSGAAEVVQKCTIRNFIDTHTQNYLVLTNYVPANVVGLTNLDLFTGKANIYYRIIAKPGDSEPKLVREAASINAQGFAADGKIQQSIDANIGLQSFLPVFHFSLYRTDSAK